MNCDKQINTKAGNKKYCSLKCKGEFTRGKNKRRTTNCIICGIEFTIQSRKALYRKTCSKICQEKRRQEFALQNLKFYGAPGYAKGRRFYYKDIVFDSSWEVDLAKWMDENSIEWVRSRKNYFHWMDGDLKRRYTPDFWLPKYDLYLDCKNPYLMKLDAEKTNQVSKQIKLIVGNVEFIIGQLGLIRSGAA